MPNFVVVRNDYSFVPPDFGSDVICLIVDFDFDWAVELDPAFGLAFDPVPVWPATDVVEHLICFENYRSYYLFGRHFRLYRHTCYLICLLVVLYCSRYLYEPYCLYS